MRASTLPAVAGVTWLPAAETKNVSGAAKCARDVRSQAARTPATWVVRGSLRLRFPLDQTTSTCPSSRSICPACRARVSPVLSPHECISVKNATASHRHGDWGGPRPPPPPRPGLGECGPPRGGAPHGGQGLRGGPPPFGPPPPPPPIPRRPPPGRGLPRQRGSPPRAPPSGAPPLAGTRPT